MMMVMLMMNDGGPAIMTCGPAALAGVCRCPQQAGQGHVLLRPTAHVPVQGLAAEPYDQVGSPALGG